LILLRLLGHLLCGCVPENLFVVAYKYRIIYQFAPPCPLIT
jgi:hypothetical protein